MARALDELGLGDAARFRAVDGPGFDRLLTTTSATARFLQETHDGVAFTHWMSRTEYYAKDGKAVAGIDGGPAPKPSAPADPPGASAAPSASPDAAASTSPQTTNATPRAGCASCAVGSGESSPPGPLLGLALAAALALRKNARARRS